MQLYLPSQPCRTAAESVIFKMQDVKRKPKLLMVCIVCLPTCITYSTVQYRYKVMFYTDNLVYPSFLLSPPPYLLPSPFASLQPRSKSLQPQKAAVPEPAKGNSKQPVSSSRQKLTAICSGEHTVLRKFEDSDDSCDSNPFSDMEDACQDLIARLH